MLTSKGKLLLILAALRNSLQEQFEQALGSLRQDVQHRWRLKYVRPGDQVNSEQRLVISAAFDHYYAQAEFIATGPSAEANCYNDMVDWLIKNYPNEFYLNEEANNE